ncbi:MAG TPA: LysR family transcriptional regulator [Burkholderiales bacterium]|nr:LysR family transcriptional regulator [Burkholderiales bacterium]
MTTEFQTPSHLLNLMSSFAAVVKAGSFTKAAVRLDLSKSVVSRHVSILEKALAVQLMYRSTHRLSLTEAGERFYLYCKDLEHVAEQAAAFATSAREQPQGLLRITLPQTLVVSPVGRLIARFQQLHSAVQLDVRVTSLQVDPIEEGFDLALRIGNLQDSNLICRKIRDVRFQAVATPGYLKRHGCPRTPDELVNHNCLVYSEFESRSRWPSGKRAARDKPAALSGNLSTNSGVLLINALLAGQGIVVGPDLMFEPYIKRRRVRVILDDFRLEPSGLYAVFPPGRFSSVNRRALVDFLIAELKSP